MAVYRSCWQLVSAEVLIECAIRNMRKQEPSRQQRMRVNWLRKEWVVWEPKPIRDCEKARVEILSYSDFTPMWLSAWLITFHKTPK